MRRREASFSLKLPVTLRSYRATDWEGRDEAARYSKWMQARRAWKDARNIIELPDDAAADAAFPDGIFYPEDI